MCSFLSNAVHTAMIAINEAVEHQVPENTLQAMKNPAAHLNNMYDDLADMYQNVLYDAKQNKAEIARNKVCWETHFAFKYMYSKMLGTIPVDM